MIQRVWVGVGVRIPEPCPAWGLRHPRCSAEGTVCLTYTERKNEERFHTRKHQRKKVA